MREYNYIIIDAALWEEDANLAIKFGAPVVSLHNGILAKNLESVAPYLFYVEGQGELIKWVNQRERKNPEKRRTLRLKSKLGIEELKKHLRRFILIKKEGWGAMFFRFYDPKVVSYTFPNLDDKQLSEFFNGVDFIEHYSDILLEKRRYSLENNQLVTSKQSIDNVDNI